MTRIHWALLLLIAAVALLLFAAPGHSTSTAPAFSIADATVAENAGSVTITISKSAKASSYSKITVQTVDGTAKAGVDYQPISATYTVANSQLVLKIPDAIIDNATYQGTRSYSVKITAVRFAAIARAVATITITDDEAPPTAWTLCAYEGQPCNISGTANVRYGAGTSWLTKTVTGSISCSVAAFGSDPAYLTAKECQTTGAVVGTVPPPPVYQCPDGAIIQPLQSCPTAPTPAPTPSPTPSPTPTPTPVGTLPTSAPLVADHAALEAAVGTTMHTLCSTTCDASPKPDPAFLAPFTYGAIYSAAVASGTSVKLLGWSLNYAGKVEWHVAFADGRDGWLFSDQLQ